MRMDSVSYFAGDTLEEKDINPPGAMDIFIVLICIIL
jgi:hypothetical protein